MATSHHAGPPRPLLSPYVQSLRESPPLFPGSSPSRSPNLLPPVTTCHATSQVSPRRLWPPLSPQPAAALFPAPSPSSPGRAQPKGSLSQKPPQPGKRPPPASALRSHSPWPPPPWHMQLLGSFTHSAWRRARLGRGDIGNSPSLREPQCRGADIVCCQIGV